MRARTRIVMRAKGNDASYMPGVLEIAHSRVRGEVYDQLGDPPSDFSDRKISQSHPVSILNPFQRNEINKLEGIRERSLAVE